MSKLTREDIEIGVKKGISFEGANLKGFDLRNLDLSSGIFKNANFRYADLSNTNLSNANLSGASLRHAVLLNANLSNADLTNADLTHADIRGAIMLGAKLDNTLIRGAKGLSEKVFFTQKALDDLNAQGKLLLEGEKITILTKTKPSFNLQQAVRFISVESGTDENRLVGKIKTLVELNNMNAEVFPDSVVINENVYRIENGFIGVPVSGDSSHEKGEEAKTKSDQELLAEFFLKNVK
ncbi:MAG: pentapeptide repeat-containing protein [bacterium]